MIAYILARSHLTPWLPPPSLFFLSLTTTTLPTTFAPNISQQGMTSSGVLKLWLTGFVDNGEGGGDTDPKRIARDLGLTSVENEAIELESLPSHDFNMWLDTGVRNRRQRLMPTSKMIEEVLTAPAANVMEGRSRVPLEVRVKAQRGYVPSTWELLLGTCVLLAAIYVTLVGEIITIVWW
jgi:hypothetical protein